MKSAPFLVIADRGQMKIFHVDEAAGSTPSMKRVDTYFVREAHQKYDERFTDQAGAFPNGGAAGQGNSIDERLPIAEETNCRIFRKLGEHLSEQLRVHGSPEWSFAAPGEINADILNEISPDLKKNLRQNLQKDLVKVPAHKLIDHFRPWEQPLPISGT